MSLTAKIMAVLSVLWVAWWVWICLPFNQSGNLHIFVLAIMPVILGWLIRAGFYFCFKKNRSAKGVETKSKFSLPAAATFKNPVRLTKWMTVFLAVEALFLALLCILKMHDFKSLHAHGLGVVFLILILGIVFIIFLFVLMVMKFMWIHKANFNTHQLGISNLSYSPRSAVGWSIVPFGIYYTMKEICKSNWYPSSAQWKDQPSPMLFKLWWATIMMNVFVVILFAVLPKTAAPLKPIFLNLFMIISEILLIMLINKLSKKQVLAHNNQQAA